MKVTPLKEAKVSESLSRGCLYTSLRCFRLQRQGYGRMFLTRVYLGQRLNPATLMPGNIDEEVDCALYLSSPCIIDLFYSVHRNHKMEIILVMVLGTPEAI